jgi:hypothetical protein
MFAANNTGGGTNPFGEGFFGFTIEGLSVKMGERVIPGQDPKLQMAQKAKEPWLQITIVYRHENGESLQEGFINAPTNWGINERSTWTKRLANMFGLDPKVLAKDEENRGKAKVQSKIFYNFGEDIKSPDDLWTRCDSGEVISFDVFLDGKSALGRSIALSIGTKESGWAKIIDSQAVITVSVPKAPPSRLETTNIQARV